MKGFNSVKQMKQSIEKLTSGVAGDTIFSAKAIYFIAKKLDELVKLQRKAKHGTTLSDFHLFMSYRLKEGMSFNDAIQEWRNMQAGDK